MSHQHMIGSSPAIQAIRAAIARVSSTDSTVLVTGETGTGKELVARGIHEASRRSQHAFVAVSGVALAPGLLASELFGHEAGSFTGASKKRIGRFEQSHQGTLFLDEIGELGGDVQAMLLRVLQERTIERVGGDTVAVDIRVISATNRDLRREVAEGRFRSDLFFRLNVFPIHVPPLRERPDDIPELVHDGLVRICLQMKRPMPTVPPHVLKLLTRHLWPGNVRELFHLLERAVIHTDDNRLIVDPDWLIGGSIIETAQTWAAQEKQRILAALTASDGRIYGPGGAAHRLGLNPTTLYGKMNKHGIQRRDRQPTNVT